MRVLIIIIITSIPSTAPFCNRVGLVCAHQSNTPKIKVIEFYRHFQKIVIIIHKINNNINSYTLLLTTITMTTKAMMTVMTGLIVLD